MSRHLGVVMVASCLGWLLAGCGPEERSDPETRSDLAAVSSTAARPQLSDSAASSYTIARYLARAGTVGSLVTDNWDPTSGVGDVSSFPSTYTVAGDGSGTHRTVQAAVNAATGSSRVYIEVRPGTYREVVCVPAGKPPITLFSRTSDASRTVIVYGNAAGKPKTAGTAANPCNPNSSSTTFGTTGSATFTVRSAGFQAKNLTFSNDYSEGTYASGQQAVALMTMSDKLVFENVRALGNQDTLFVSSGGFDGVARAYFRNSYIEGDVDFIFGRATAVFDGCTVSYRSSRQGSNASYNIAPSTVAGNEYGFLFVNSRFSADSGAPSNKIYLGRSWDEGVAAGAYVAGTSPNGQAVIRNCTLDGHIRLADPWGTSTSSRPFSSSGNRFSEYLDVGAGSGNGTSYTLTVGVSGGGTTSPAPGAHAYPAGTQVTVVAAAASGSTFGGWSGACSGTGACTVTMNANQTVTATFRTSDPGTYTLTVNKAGTGSGTVTGPGIACGGTCSGSFTQGSSVTLTAEAAGGSTFDGWGGACSGMGTCVVAMSAARTVTASFTPSTGTTCKAASGGQSGNFDTTGAICFTVSGAVNGWGCSNVDGRTVTVNGTAVTCGRLPLPGSSPYTFSFTAGVYTWASFYWW